MHLNKFVENHLDFEEGYYTVQAGKEVVFFSRSGDGQSPHHFTKESQTSRVKIHETGVAAALTHRAAPSICNYVEEFIFFSGGFDPNTMESIKTVDIYDVHTDRWSTDAPPLNQARAFHSSCALGNMLYVLCGRQKNRLINSIDLVIEAVTSVSRVVSTHAKVVAWHFLDDRCFDTIKCLLIELGLTGQHPKQVKCEEVKEVAAGVDKAISLIIGVKNDVVWIIVDDRHPIERNYKATCVTDLDGAAGDGINSRVVLVGSVGNIEATIGVGSRVLSHDTACKKLERCGAVTDNLVPLASVTTDI